MPTDNRNCPDVRISAKERWKGDAHLGRPCGSKTLAPRYFGDDRHEPDEVFLALRAWMLYMWQANDRRFLELPCRLHAWQREHAALEADVRGRGGEAVLNPRTARRTSERAPDVLS